MRLIFFHILLLLMLPVLWHLYKEHESAGSSGPGKAPTADLAGARQDYYDTVFSYAMEAMPADKPYRWKEQNAEGVIIAGKRFVSMSGAHCRPYTESYRINGVSGALKGTACRRRDEGDSSSWCKVPEGGMMSCALEHSEDFMDELF